MGECPLYFASCIYINPFSLQILLLSLGPMSSLRLHYLRITTFEYLNIPCQPRLPLMRNLSQKFPQYLKLTFIMHAQYENQLDSPQPSWGYPNSFIPRQLGVRCILYKNGDPWSAVIWWNVHQQYLHLRLWHGRQIWPSRSSRKPPRDHRG